MNLLITWLLISVTASRAAVVSQIDTDPDKNGQTWDDFEEKNPITVPTTTTEEPDVDWEETDYPTEEPKTSGMIGVKTIIAIEFGTDEFESVFLRGGYTGSSTFTCNGKASENSCSIPIRHLIPDGVSPNYTAWADGDLFLDMLGAEEKQGLAGDTEASGTPMRKMEAGPAMSRCNTDTSGKQTKTTRDRTKSTFWLVELDMDCSETYGYFEVKVVGRLKNSDKLWYEHEIEGKSGRSRAVDESCVGGIGGEIPYIADSHIGFCGLANIFYYKKSYCEVNKIIDA